MSKAQFEASDQVLGGAYLLNNAFKCEGGAVDGEPYGLVGRIPAIVLTMPLEQGTSTIHLVFNDARALLELKTAMMDLDMTNMYPESALQGTLDETGKMKFDPDDIKKRAQRDALNNAHKHPKQ